MSTTSSDAGISDDGGFAITDSQVNFANNLATFGTIPGTCVCFLVLAAYGVVACFPKARKFLDRVSFRLLVYALVSNVGFGIAYAATPAAPGTGCNFGAFCVNLFLTFSTFFTTSIAINLQLVLVHHKNGQRLEKYYLIGTTLLTLVLNVPTFALHQFGWDEESETCWFKNADPSLKLRWVIGTQSFWIVLAATFETICSTIALIWMFSYYHRYTRALGQAVLEIRPSSKENANGVSVVAINQEKRDRSKKSTAEASSAKVNDADRVEEFIRKRQTDIRKDPRYRNAVLRIALYPIVSLICNYPTVALDLKTTIQAGLETQQQYRLLVVDLFVYAIRPLAYGLIAATDPSFIMAIRETMGRTYNMRNRSSSDRLSAALEFASMRGESDSGGGDPATVAWNRESITQTKIFREIQSDLQSTPDAGEGASGDEGMGEKDRVSIGISSHERFSVGDEEIGVVPFDNFDYEEDLRKANRQL